MFTKMIRSALPQDADLQATDSTLLGEEASRVSPEAKSEVDIDDGNNDDNHTMDKTGNNENVKSNNGDGDAGDSCSTDSPISSFRKDTVRNTQKDAKLSSTPSRLRVSVVPSLASPPHLSRSPRQRPLNSGGVGGGSSSSTKTKANLIRNGAPTDFVPLPPSPQHSTTTKNTSNATSSFSSMTWEERIQLEIDAAKAGTSVVLTNDRSFVTSPNGNGGGDIDTRGSGNGNGSCANKNNNSIETHWGKTSSASSPIHVSSPTQHCMVGTDPNNLTHQNFVLPAPAASSSSPSNTMDVYNFSETARNSPSTGAHDGGAYKSDLRRTVNHRASPPTFKVQSSHSEERTVSRNDFQPSRTTSSHYSKDDNASYSTPTPNPSPERRERFPSASVMASHGHDDDDDYDDDGKSDHTSNDHQLYPRHSCPSPSHAAICEEDTAVRSSPLTTTTVPSSEDHNHHDSLDHIRSLPGDEKKEDSVATRRHARFATEPPGSPETTPKYHQDHDENAHSPYPYPDSSTTLVICIDGDGDELSTVADEFRDCLSTTESEVASVDGLPTRLQEHWLLGKTPREKMMQSLDGIQSVPVRDVNNNNNRDDTTSNSYFDSHQSLLVPAPRSSSNQHGMADDGVTSVTTQSNNNGNSSILNGGLPTVTAATDDGPFFEPCMGICFWGENNCAVAEDDEAYDRFASWKEQHDVPLAILDCTNLVHQEDRGVTVQAPPVPTSLVRVASDHPNPTYAETILPTEIDQRMQDWIINQFEVRKLPPKDGSYHLGQSRTVIVHEINRGNWTWCTAWSPDGAKLAVATENHHLAMVDTTSSTVWRVTHDRRIRDPQKSNTTHSIRSMAWGQDYIAIGGTGNAVSIVSPIEPHNVVHTMPGTGFVGCLNWRNGTNVLAIGSRLDCVMIVRIVERCDEEDHEPGSGSPKSATVTVRSELLHRIDYKYWVNSVAFSPDGTCISVGDSGGIVSVYEYEENGNDVETNMITWFKRKDSILSIEWSPDGKWMYAGGEDRSVTVVDTTYWEIVHRIGQDRWVQCIAASFGGSHVAIGGVSSEISILDVANGWDSVMGIELKGLVPLSAKWHPKDQYLALTGQDSSILVVETTNARHVKGHHLHSISPILAIEFSPDGRMAIVGNEAGVVTFYSLSGTSFITAYELLIPLNDRICMKWSLNGLFVVIGSMSNLMIVGRKRNKRQGSKCPPNASGFSVKKVMRDFGETNAVSVDLQSHFIAVSGLSTRILDARADFATVREWKHGPYYANAWSADGRRLALIGKEKFLTIYDTSANRVDRWRPIFSMKCDFVGRALAWAPLIVGGLMYLAYGGDSNEIYIMEIRVHEGTWETVLRVPRGGSINALDWSSDGLLAAGIKNGTVCIVDLAYLHSGTAVHEMDYNWQRQAITCFTEIRRNRGRNSIQSLRWLPAAPGSDRLLAIGGTDGEVEIIDLTERRRCRGYARRKVGPENT